MWGKRTKTPLFQNQQRGTKRARGGKKTTKNRSRSQPCESECTSKCRGGGIEEKGRKEAKLLSNGNYSRKVDIQDLTTMIYYNRRAGEDRIRKKRWSPRERDPLGVEGKPPQEAISRTQVGLSWKNHSYASDPTHLGSNGEGVVSIKHSPRGLTAERSR